MKRIATVLMLLCLTISVIAQKIEEKGVVLEYKGRKAKEPLPQVKIKAIGSNWATSDTKGTFILTFDGMHSGDIVENPKISRSGYVLFNKDAVSQWRLSGNSTFNIVMCNEDDFTNLLQQYYGIYEKSYKKEYDDAIAALEREREKSKMEQDKYENTIQSIKNEYNRKLKDINNYVELFAYIDENEANEIILRAIECFKENKLEEALKLYQSQKIKEQLDEQINVRQQGEEIVKAGNSVISIADSNATVLIPMLRQEIELYKLTGKRNSQQLAEDLISLIRAYKNINIEHYKKDLAMALCDLGNIYYEEYDYKNAFITYKESADYGNSFAQFRLGRLYENFSDVFDMSLSKHYYQLAASQNNDEAKERLEDFWDFYLRNGNGVKIYYKILSDSKKGGTVKITYYSTNDHRVQSYDRDLTLTVIPPIVKHKGKDYKVTEIGHLAFSYSFVTRMILPNTIERIDDKAFEYSFDLKSINISDKVSFIGDNAFRGCHNLEFISIEPSNKYYSFRDGIIYTKDLSGIIVASKKISGKICIPEGVRTIEAGAFDDCREITELQLPSTLKTIKDNSFDGCNIKVVTIPEGVESIGDGAFNTNSLLSINLPSTLNIIEGNPFYMCENLRTINLSPNNLAFSKKGPLLMDKKEEKVLFCERKLSGTLIIPSSVKSICSNSFYNCFFNTILLSERIDTIGNNSLYFNRSFSMTIPPTVKFLDEYGLFYNKDLIELFFNKDLMGMDEASAYAGYTFCPDIYSFSKEPISAAKNAFGSVDFEKSSPSLFLHVPVGSKELYMNHRAWGYFQTIIGDLLTEEDFKDELLTKQYSEAQLLFKKALIQKSEANYEKSRSLLVEAKTKTDNCNLLSEIYWQLGLTGIIFNDSTVHDDIIQSISLMDFSSEDSISYSHTFNRLICASYLLSRYHFPQSDSIFSMFEKYLEKAYDLLRQHYNPQLINSFLYTLEEILDYTYDYIKYSNCNQRDFVCAYKIFDKINYLYAKVVDDFGCEDCDADFAYSRLETKTNRLYRNISDILPIVYESAINANNQEIKMQYLNLCNLYSFLFDEEKYVDLRNKNKDSYAALRELVNSHTFEKFKVLSSFHYDLINNSDSTKWLQYKKWFDIHHEDIQIASARKELYAKLKLQEFNIVESIKKDILSGIVEQPTCSEKWHYDDSFQTTINMLQENSLKTTYYYLKNKVENNSLSALLAIAQLCIEGIGMPKNEEIAIELYDYACQRGDTISIELLQKYYFEKEEYQQAYKYLQSSSTPYSLWCLGQMYQHGYYVNWNLEKAVEYYKKLKFLGYDNQQLFESVAKTFNELAYDEMNSDSPIQQSLNYIDKAIELCPTNPNYYDSKGEIYLKYDNIDEAIKMWEKVLEIDPDVLEHWEEEGIESVLYRKLKEYGKL